MISAPKKTAYMVLDPKAGQVAMVLLESKIFFLSPTVTLMNNDTLVLRGGTSSLTMFHSQ